MPGVARNNSELPSRVMKSWPDRDWICTMDEDEVGEEEEEEEDGMGWDGMAMMRMRVRGMSERASEEVKSAAGTRPGGARADRTRRNYAIWHVVQKSRDCRRTAGRDVLTDGGATKEGGAREGREGGS